VTASRCVPCCQPQTWRVASRVVNPRHDELRPAVTKELHQLHRKIWAYKMSNNWKVLTHFLYFTLYSIICTHEELLNDFDNTVVISCYCLMFKPYFRTKKSFRGRRQAQYVQNIVHFKLLLWSDENTVSGKSFNAVSLGVPSTWPLNCAHMIFIHSAESPAWYFINILLFHVQKLFSWFSKYVWKLVAHFCVNSCFHSWYEKDSRNIRLNRYQ